MLPSKIAHMRSLENTHLLYTMSRFGMGAALSQSSLDWYATSGFLDCVTQLHKFHDCIQHVNMYIIGQA